MFYETHIFPENQMNTVAVDALVPQGARASVAMILNMKTKQIFDFHEAEFQILGK